MTDEAWMVEQQRLHNYRSFKFDLPPMRPRRRKPNHFTLEQLQVAERWAQQKAKQHG